MKRAFIIHGWGGNPKEGWHPSLAKELEKNGFKVTIPSMPDTDNPKIDKWVTHLKKAVKKADSDTYFIGHSIGCQTILRYLQTVDSKIGGAIFVAGWFSLKTCEEEEKKIARPWIETPIDFVKIKKVLPKSTAIFSDNDPYVDYAKNSRIFKTKLGSKTILLKNKGHFDMKELPIVVKEISAFT